MAVKSSHPILRWVLLLFVIVSGALIYLITAIDLSDLSRQWLPRTASEKQEEIRIAANLESRGFLVFDHPATKKPKAIIVESSRAEFTENHAKQLAQLHSLEDITITDQRKLSALLGEPIDSERTFEVSDASLQQLSTLPRLNSLRLSSVPISEKGFRSIGKMKNLRRLILQPPTDAPVSVEGLLGLSELSNLESLELFLVQDDAIAILPKLAESLPNCRIECRTGDTTTPTIYNEHK